MALAKFSKFKKERAVIKEARSKEKKVANFKKLFNEKLTEMGVKSVADLSEEQINKLLGSLGTVNEDRMREIEKDGIIAGTPKDAGEEAEVAKKHTFTSPQKPDVSSTADAENMKAEESVDEGVVEDIRSNLIDKPISAITALYKKYVGANPRKEIASNSAAMITMIATMAAENKQLAKALLMEGEEEVSEAEVTKADLDKVAKKADDAEKKADDAEAKADDAEDKAKDAEKEAGKGDEIKNDKEFEEYAMAALKKAHPDDFDEKIAKDVISGLKKKHDGDYGAMVGALTSGFGG